MRRLANLDIIRGFALCGILFANAPALLHLNIVRDDGVDPIARVLTFVVNERFFPLFSLLFGVGFALMWQTASARARSPRAVLLRRILALGVLGAGHQLLQPGEALLPYAIGALVVLVPVTFLPPRWAPLASVFAGVAVTVAGLVFGGGILLIPGLFLLGFAAGTAGLFTRLEAAPERVLPVLVVLVPATVAALLLQYAQPALSGAAGLIMAATYAAILLLLLRTPLFPVLHSVFGTLGRTALTNYIGATLIVVTVRIFAEPLGLAPDAPRAWPRMLLLCVAILAVQAVISSWWLRRFGQGPLERLWRKATWYGAASTAGHRLEAAA